MYNLQITPKNTPQNSINPYSSSRQISFGQITPEHLFIRIRGFNKNQKWADTMVKTVNKTKSKISKGKNFDKVYKSIYKNYHKFFKRDYSLDSEIRKVFGVFRSDADNIETVCFANKFKSYRQRFIEFFNKFESIDSFNKSVMAKSKSVKIEKPIGENGKNVELSTMEISDNYLYLFENTGEKEKFVAVHTPPATSVKPVLKHIEKLYKDVTSIKKVKTQEDLNFANKKIAEMHWYFTQVMPFKRGSAGIADVFTKSIYESLGVQVHPWKQGVAPDLEAYVRNFDDYVENYPSFFEKPPEIMK